MQAYELSVLTGSEVLVIVGSQTGRVNTFATPKMQPILTEDVSKKMIEACLSSVDGVTAADNLNRVVDDEVQSRSSIKGLKQDQTLPSIPPDNDGVDNGYASAPPSRPSSAVGFGFPFPQHAANPDTSLMLPWIMPAEDQSS